MDAGLLAAYGRTEYRVDDAGHRFVMRIGTPSPELRDCHAAWRVTCSTFITGWNPRSTPMPLAVNEAEMKRLEQALAASGWHWLRGTGVDPDGDWEGEPSLLVLGLDEPAAVDLGRRFDQHAIVFAGPDAIPRLIVIT